MTDSSAVGLPSAFTPLLPVGTPECLSSLLLTHIAAVLRSGLSAPPAFLASTLLSPLSSHLGSPHSPRRTGQMVSLPHERIRGPVRVLIRTRPVHLQAIHPSFEKADTALIDKLCAKYCDKYSAAEVQHLITRIADERRSERVDIVFDYGVPAEEPQPEVVAFKLKVQDSEVLASEISHPEIKSRVNDMVGWWRGINIKNNITFPSRTDVRRRRRGLDVGSGVSTSGPF